MNACIRYWDGIGTKLTSLLATKTGRLNAQDESVSRGIKSVRMTLARVHGYCSSANVFLALTTTFDELLSMVQGCNYFAVTSVFILG